MNVAVNGDVPTTSAGTAISTVGVVASHAAVALAVCAGPALRTPSVAAFAPTDTVTSAFPDGATASV